MAESHTRWAWAALAVLLALLAACVLFGTSASQFEQRQRLLDARLRWRSQAPAHYRLVSATDEGCTIDVEVRDERVLHINQQDACMHPVRTVSDLFQLIERGQVSAPCFFAGCACRIDVVAVVDYDTTYGYPARITLRSDRGPNWWNASFWQYIATQGRPPGCTSSASSPVARVLSFTPLR
jgi:hypothetical protein